MIRDSKIAVLKSRRNVYKIPLSLSGMKEMLLEKFAMPKIKADPHFSLYVPNYKYYCGFIQSTPKLTELGKHPDPLPIIEQYFILAFKGEFAWQKDSAQAIINPAFFKFLEEQGLNPNYWKEKLGGTQLPLSSIHGDFHLNNILLKDDKLMFIDWIRYQEKSCRYFDLIDFYVFFSKNFDESWMDAWKKLYESNKRQIFSVPVENEYVLIYGIWKMAEELKTLYDRKALNKPKTKKYISFIHTLQNAMVSPSNKI